MTIEEAIKFAEYAQLMTDFPDVQEFYKLAEVALRVQQEREKRETLKTTWETPETCPNCMEHLSLDWSFCPECGRPTAWSTNEPLTLDELREMNAPVWCLCKPLEGGNGYWCLCQNGHITTPAGSQYFVSEIPHWVFLRHKPKEETKC